MRKQITPQNITIHTPYNIAPGVILVSVSTSKESSEGGSVDYATVSKIPVISRLPVWPKVDSMSKEKVDSMSKETCCWGMKTAMLHNVATILKSTFMTSMGAGSHFTKRS